MIHLVALHVSFSRQMPGFMGAIQSNSHFVSQVVPNVWVLATNLTPTQLNNVLMPHILQTDRLLVIRVTSDFAGWLSGDVRQWLTTAKDEGWFQ